MKLLLPIAVAAVVTAGPVYGACTYPQGPGKAPDGNTATLEEMVAAQKAVKAYDTEINAYVSCLKLEHDAAIAKEGANLTDDQKKEMERVQVQKHNAAIEELEAVASRFNEQVRVFKAKKDKKS